MTPTPGDTFPYPRGSARAAGGGGGALPPPRIAGDEFMAAAPTADPTPPALLGPRREEPVEVEALPLPAYWSKEEPGGRALAEGDTPADDPGPRFRPAAESFFPWMF